MGTRKTLNATEVGALLGVSYHTALRMVHRGDLRGYKKTSAPNSAMRIYRDSVLEFITEKQERQLPDIIPEGE